MLRLGCKVVPMPKPTLIPIATAVLHFGRKPDGYGGKSALARLLGVRADRIGRWAGPYMPEAQANKLLRKDHTASGLLVEPVPSPNTNVTPRRKRPTRKSPA